MEKALLSVALVLAVAGFWAFYPKAAEREIAELATDSQLLLIGNFTLNGFTADANVTTITTKSQLSKKPVEVKIRGAEKVAAGFVEMRKVALAKVKVNELSKSGCHVVSAAPNNYSRGGTTFVV